MGGSCSASTAVTAGVASTPEAAGAALRGDLRCSGLVTPGDCRVAPVADNQAAKVFLVGRAAAAVGSAWGVGFFSV